MSSTLNEKKIKFLTKQLETSEKQCAGRKETIEKNRAKKLAELEATLGADIERIKTELSELQNPSDTDPSAT